MISVNCPCKCNGSRRHNGQCAHEQPTDGEHVDSSENNCSPDKDIYSPESCKLSPDQPTCSGRGVCACRNCLCHKTKLGTIYGKYCEMDDFSCPYHDGKMCDGHGECEDGICKCFRGWGGDQCQCPSSTEECMNSKGEICSGRGTCSCGKCWCSEQGSFGRFCEYCNSCTKVCENNWNCLQCHISHNTSQPLQHHCKTSCTKLIYFLDQTSECFSDSTHFRIFSIIVIITFLVGLLGVLITRQIVLRRSNNKMTSSAHYRDSSRMEKVFLPAASSRTVTYTLDKPEERKIDITKLQVHETFKCKFEDNVLNEGFSP